jgi:hypothetical protein
MREGASCWQLGSLSGRLIEILRRQRKPEIFPLDNYPRSRAVLGSKSPSCTAGGRGTFQLDSNGLLVRARSLPP